MTVTACERSRAVLSCSSGHHIVVYEAMYGRSDARTCLGDSSVAPSGGCVAPDSFDVVRDRCEGQQYCRLAADRTHFSDVCPSGSFNFLRVKYSCRAFGENLFFV